MGLSLGFWGYVAVTYIKESVRARIPRKIFTTGAGETGKTSLYRQLETPSVDIGEVTERTKNPEKIEENFTASWSNEFGAVITRRLKPHCDVPGQQPWWGSWIYIIFKHKPDIIYHVIDHSHLDNLEDWNNQNSFSFLVNNLVSTHVSRPFGARKYKPKLIVLVANKWDIWHKRWGKRKENESRRKDGSIYKPIYCYKCAAVGDCDCEEKYKSFHPIFYPFRGELQKLGSKDIKIPTMLWVMSARYGDNVQELYETSFKKLEGLIG